MNVPLTPAATPPHADTHGYVRLRGRWPLVMRGVWLVALALAFAATLTSFPPYLEQLRTPCVTAVCPYQQLTTAQITSLTAIGVTPVVYLAITVALALIALVVCWTLSALIIWRRPDDWMAALVALMLIPLGVFLIAIDLTHEPRVWGRLITYVFAALSPMQAVIFCLFPSGRFTPRWSRWVLVALVALLIASLIAYPWIGAAAGPTYADLITGPIGGNAALIAVAVVQIIRYRAYSTPLQRQQTKWVIIGLMTPVAFIAPAVGYALIAPAAWKSAFFALWAYEASFFFPFFPALGFALSMLRYRLWEIDRLINRALVYGALTLILTGLYAGLVIGVQTLARGYIGQDNNLVIVLSTLLIAALVLPLRRGLQTLIDRQFYRHKYDAARTLQTFSASLRHEFQVEALREQLLRAANETMRPAHVSLWLRPAREDERSQSVR
ncbi:MAG TPA: hypothetical protein VF808_18505 [Ktedonobacterales bacterium]